MIFAGSGHNLPPADTTKLAIQVPMMATAIVLFDAWICNPDRHEFNLHYDEVTQQVTIFDHGRALFASDGVANLSRFHASICISPDLHAVMLDLRSFVGFDEWLDRILQLPEWQVYDAVSQARLAGVSDDEIKTLTTFLLERRTLLRTFFHQAQGDRKLFPHVQGVFGVAPEPPPSGPYDDYAI